MHEENEFLIEEKGYNGELILCEEKAITIYIMLEYRQRVNYQVFYDIFGATRRTFRRVLTTIRRAFENAGIYEAQIFYNRTTQNYELVKAHFRIN